MAQKITTQDFTEIADITGNIVIFTSGAACMVTEIYSSNFALLSYDEQAAKVAGFTTFLNSLTFPLQLLVINKRVDITNYVTVLNEEETKAPNQMAKEYIGAYRSFVQNLVKNNIVLDKRFFAVVSYSPLESGIIGAIDTSGIVEKARGPLSTKTDSVRNLLTRMNLSSKTLTDNELTELYKDMYTV